MGKYAEKGRKEEVCMLFAIDKLSRKPIYEQIVERFIEQIHLGLLKEGDRLPSVRELSSDLDVNPNTIQKAYLELDRMGIIASAPGRGSFVTAAAVDIVRNQRLKRLGELPALVKELKSAGVTEEELLRLVTEAYRS